MFYNVARQLKDGVGAVREYTIDETVLLPGEEFERFPVQGDVRFLRTLRGILITGDLAAEVPQTCSRCLEPFDQTLTLPVEEEFFPTIDVMTGLPLKAPEEAGPFIIDQSHMLNLVEAVRQAVVLNSPMSALCREDCAGLCSICGQNRNTALCACPVSSTARLGNLGSLLQDWSAADKT